MRRLLFFALASFLLCNGYGQTIDRMEYFFDSDPGYGAGTALSYSPGSSVTATFYVNTAGLSKGVHFLLVRAKNVNGKWSTVTSAPVCVLDPGPGITVTKLEYYIDNDPGFGSATPVTIAPGTQVPALFQVNAVGLSDGLHYLSVRAMDDQSRWSVLSSSLFYREDIQINTAVTRLEYFTDTDPGFGNGTALPVSSGTTITASFQLEASGAGPGMHFINLRAMDAKKRWSILSSFPFVKMPNTTGLQIDAIEYFIDTDPGFGAATPLTIAPGQNVTAVFTPAVSSLSNGLHLLCIRARNQAGMWSNLQQYLFFTEPANRSPVAAMEYFFDTDPGFGNAQAIAITPSLDVTAQFSPDTTGLTPSQHMLVVRTRDMAGNWSLMQNASFDLNSTARTWAGTVSDDWNVAGNWSPAGVPGWNDDVLIPASAPFMPVVRNQGHSCRNLVVTPGGGAVQISPGYVLTVNGTIHLD